MSKKIIYLLFAVSIGLNLGMIGMTVVNRAARPGPPPPGQGPGRGPRGQPDPERIIEDHVRNITQHLDLDDSQSQAIREIMAGYVPALIQLRTQAETAKGGLSAAYGAAEFDPEGFRLLTAEVSQARARVDSLSALILVEEAAVLTSEQRKKFAEVAPNIHSQPQGPQDRQGRPGRDGPPPEGRRPKDDPPPR